MGTLFALSFCFCFAVIFFLDFTSSSSSSTSPFKILAMNTQATDPLSSLDALKMGVKITSRVQQEESQSDKDVFRVHLNSNTLFKAYCDDKFCILRNLAGFSSAEYGEEVQESIPFNPESKSGQSFWKSANELMVVKTIHKDEAKTLREMIDSYLKHISDTYDGDGSCISFVLGLYSVFKRGSATYFMVTKNVFPPSERCIREIYDLKGSLVGRKATIDSHILKDVDAIERMNSSGECLLSLLPADRDRFLRVLKRDVSFLQAQRVLDYSLLLAVENIETTQKVADDAPRGKFTLLSSNPQLAYHIGIIDYLTKYSFRKKMETIIKGVWHKVTTLSAVNPNIYAQRFVRFVHRICGKGIE